MGSPDTSRIRINHRRGDLVVIANRLPVHRTSPESPWETSPGGLVSALCPSYVKIKVYGSVGREL